MKYKWKYKFNHNPLRMRKYEENGISPLLASIMINRHFTIDDYGMMKNGFWDQVKEYCADIVDLNSAAKLMTEALFDTNSIIYIFSDYDTDGITSLMIAVESFKTIRKWRFDGKEPDNIKYYIPNRSEGYGLNLDFCNSVIKEKNADNGEHNFYVVTFDNGITKKNEIRYLRNNGIRTLVTDHHEPEEDIPEGTVVDPKKDLQRKGEELCGAGIAFLLAMRMYMNFSLNTYIVHDNYEKSIMNDYLCPMLQKVLGYAAIGTIGDIMPMTLFNISLVKHGLDYLNDKTRNEKNPIDLLKDMLDIKEITGKDIGFGISAAINACGQMNKIETIVDFVMSPDFETMEKNLEKVKEIYEKNKDITKKMKSELDKRIKKGEFDNDNFCLVTIEQKPDIPSGIAGKLANHVATETNKPTIVLFKTNTKLSLKGSGRCPNHTINMLELLQSHREDGLVEKANGHALACGVAIENDKITELRNALNEDIREGITDGNISTEIEQEIDIDAKIGLDDINFETFRQINNLPYSNDFGNPVFLVTADIVKVSHSKNNPNNVCYEVVDSRSRKDMKIWVWNKKPYEYDPEKHTKIVFVGNICRNFMFNKMLTLDIIDLKFE